MYEIVFLCAFVLCNNAQPLSYLEQRDILDTPWKLYNNNGLLGILDFNLDGSLNVIVTQQLVGSLITVMPRSLFINTTQQKPDTDNYNGRPFTGEGLPDGIKTNISNPNPNPTDYTEKPVSLAAISNFNFNSTDQSLTLLSGEQNPIGRFYYSMRDFYGKWHLTGREINKTIGFKLFLVQLI